MLETDHLQNLARWLVKKLDEYHRVRVLYPEHNLKSYQLQGRKGQDWLDDVLQILKDR
jgi:hypothetical protein